MNTNMIVAIGGAILGALGTGLGVYNTVAKQAKQTKQTKEKKEEKK